MNTTNISETNKDYDYTGAAMYAAGILIYYSTGLVLMLFFHVRPRKFQNQSIFDYEENDRSATAATNPFAHYHDVQTSNTQKQILNELKDPERRERLWKIYYSSREKHKEPHPQYYQTVASDTVTIGRINRKLATIHQMSIDDDTDVLPTVNLSSNNTGKFFAKSFNSIRRFSGGQTKPLLRPSLFRVQSEPETPPTAELHSSKYNIESEVTRINDRSNGQTKKYLNRFTIEKVSDESIDKESDST